MASSRCSRVPVMRDGMTGLRSSGNTERMTHDRRVGVREIMLQCAARSMLDCACIDALREIARVLLC